MKAIIKSFTFSWKLVWEACGASVLLYLLIDVLQSLIPLLDLYFLNVLLENITPKDHDGIVLSVALIISTTASGIFLSGLQGIISDHVREKSDESFNKLILNKLYKMPFEILDTSEGRDKMDYASCCSNIVCNEIPFGVFYILRNIYTFVIAAIVLIQYNIVFFILFLLLTIPGILLDYVFNKKTDELSRKTAPDIRKMNYYRWMLVDAWPAKDVRMYDLTDSIKKRYNAEKSKFYKKTRQLDNKRTGASVIAEMIRRAGELIFVLFVILDALRGDLTIGDVVLFCGYAIIISETFSSIINRFVGYVKLDSETVMPKFFEFMEYPSLEESSGARKLTKFESLTFENVWFKYPTSDDYVLKGASFTLYAGDKISIIGINGAGKSTIIKLMLGLYQIDAGKILINGYPMNEYDLHDIRKIFSVLFQNFVQYPLTLRENVALSDLEKIPYDAEIESVLRQSGVYDDLKPKLQNGLNSYMTRQFHDKGTELSKGQWQKIALARAYFKNSQITVFDEPSAALDAQAEDQIFSDFEKIAEGKTAIMISHRISSARSSNKIIVLDGGIIAETGSHDELVAKNGLYAKLYMLQKKKYTMEEENENEAV